MRGRQRFRVGFGICIGNKITIDGGALGDAPHKVDKPRALVPVMEACAVGDAADQVTAPIGKIYPATSHAEQYIINSR